MNAQVQPAGGRRGISTSAGITLIAAGAILRFAVATTSTHGLNVHVVGVILMLAGILGLVLSLLVWGPLNRRRNRSAGSDRAVPPRTRRGVYRYQPSARDDQRAYQDQPTVRRQSPRDP